MRVVLRRGNDQVVTLTGLRTTDSGTFLNDAMVTATLFDSRGNVVPGLGNVPMLYVAGSNGNYEWQIDAADTMISKSVEYSLEIKAKQQELDYRTVHVVSVVDGDTGVTSTASSSVPGPPGPSGPPGPAGPQGPAGVSTSVFAYKPDTTTQQAQDPGPGRFRWNTVVQQEATFLYFDWLTDDDFDAHLLFELTPPASRVVIQDQDLADSYQEWEILEVVRSTDWFGIQVALLNQSGPGGVCVFPNNKRVMVLVLGASMTQIANRVTALEAKIGG